MKVENRKLKEKANHAVRMRAREKNVPLWMVADKFGKSESRFTVILRHELPEEVQNELCRIIDAIADEGNQI